MWIESASDDSVRAGTEQIIQTDSRTDLDRSANLFDEVFEQNRFICELSIAHAQKKDTARLV